MVSARENRNSRCHSSNSPSAQPVRRPCTHARPWRASPRSRCQLAHNSFDIVPPGCSDVHGRQGVDRMVRSRSRPGSAAPGWWSSMAAGAGPARRCRKAHARNGSADPASTRRARRSGAHGHPPAVARLPDHQVGVGAGVVEEHLVELGVAGELDDRADLDARLIQRHQQVRHRRAA